MITQCCYLEDYDWLVKVFYEVLPKDAKVILKELDLIECERGAFSRLKNIFEGEYIDCGFTYTDSNLRVTFMILFETSCAAEFRNTFDHEKGHTVAHIAKYFGIDPFGEQVLYLSQDLGAQMFLIAHSLMCDNCRLQLINYGKVKVKIKSGQ